MELDSKRGLKMHVLAIDGCFPSVSHAAQSKQRIDEGG